MAAAFLLAGLLAGCRGDTSQEATDAGGPGHATLRFSGAVSGQLDQDLEVTCLRPQEMDGRFDVSIDSETGVRVGERTFLALDLYTPVYDGPKTYDLGAARNDGFDPGDFFLLFEEVEDDPFGWGEGRAAGTLTIGPGEASGALALRGWRNSAGDVLDVEGAFRCGGKAGRD